MAGSRIVPHVASKVVVPRQVPRSMGPAPARAYVAPAYVPTGHPSVSAPTGATGEKNFDTAAYAPTGTGPTLVGNKSVKAHAQTVHAALYGVPDVGMPAYAYTALPLAAGTAAGTPASQGGGGGGGGSASSPTPDSTPTLQSQPGTGAPTSSQAAPLAVVPPAPLATPTSAKRPLWQVFAALGVLGFAGWWFFFRGKKKSNPARRARARARARRAR